MSCRIPDGSSLSPLGAAVAPRPGRRPSTNRRPANDRPRKVMVHLPDAGGCGYYRAIAPATFLSEPLLERGVHLLLEHDISRTDRYDAVMVHRIVAPSSFPVLLRQKYYGAEILWDIDDDIDRIPGWSPASMSEDAVGLYHASQALADARTASTPTLAAVVGAAAVLPNLMDCDLYAGFTNTHPPKPADAPVRVVWAGSTTHRHDLARAAGPLDALLRKYGPAVEVVFFGMTEPALLARWFARGVGYLEPVKVERYPATLCGLRPDIGICPLADHAFNRSKSNIKWMELSLAGAACVVQRIDAYDCVRDGVDGLTADTEADWLAALDRLVGDAAERKRLQTNASRRIVADLSWQTDNAGRRAWADWLAGVREGVTA